MNPGPSPRPPVHGVTQEAFGDAYEDFVSNLYISAIRLGLPTRAGLRAEQFDDPAITVGTSELVARGLLSPTDDPDVWEVVPPREALPRYAERVVRRMETTRATASQVEALWRRAVGERPMQSHSGFDLLLGVGAIAHQIEFRHQTAVRRVWWAIDRSAAGRRLLEEVLDEPARLAVREGVERRLVLDTALLDSEAALEHARRSRALGQSVGVANGLPFSVLLSDSTAAVVDLSRFDQHGEGSIEVRRTSPVQALERLLEVIWGLATPYGPRLLEGFEEEQRLPLSERDLRILTLLTTGASDQVIARQSGVSVRTVERRVRHLMDRLGSATRFQAGVQAVRRGWI